MSNEQRVTTWADGFGNWFARVPADCVSPLIAARRALRDVIVPRDAHADRSVWAHPVRVPDMDGPDTVVYREGTPGEGGERKTMLRLTLTIVADDEDAVLDAVKSIGEMGTPTMELNETNEAETSDGANVEWKWEQQ